jgi:hypothetical protein
MEEIKKVTDDIISDKTQEQEVMENIGENKKSKKEKETKEEQTVEDDKTLFERELKLIKEKAIEDTLGNFFETDEETVKKIIEVYNKNLVRCARSGKHKENEALTYLESLYEENKLEKDTLDKFKEFEKYRRIIKKKPFNTKRMVNLILNKFKVTTEEHLRATLDLVMGKNWLAPEVEMLPFKKFVAKKEVKFVKSEW